jgi:hypothetical protein
MSESVAAEANLTAQTTEVTTGEAPSPFDRVKIERKNSDVLMSVRDSYNKLYYLDEEAANGFLNLHDMILPAQKDADDPSPEDDSDLWLPSLIAIASRKSEKPEGIEAFTNAGDGGLYFHETRQAVPKDMLFYPLYSHVRHSWWGDGDRSGKVNCQSMDGVTGQRFHGEGAGSYFQCGTETCPNMPDRFQPSTDECKYTRDFYVIDQQTTNIYKFSLKYFSLKLLQEFMIKATKRDNIKFNPKSGKWFKVRTESVGTPDRKGWYYKATATTEEITEAQAHIINQAKLLIKQYYTNQLAKIADEATESQLKGDANMDIVEAAMEGVEHIGTGENSEDYANI